jgi:hypothetical protein
MWGGGDSESSSFYLSSLAFQLVVCERGVGLAEYSALLRRVLKFEERKRETMIGMKSLCID